MENVFQVGDVVYHPSEGKGKVTNTSESLVYAITESGAGFCASKNLFSFSPWPAPNHIRPEPPVKEGWWLVHVKGDEAPLARYVSEKSVYITDAKDYIAGHLDRYVLVHYLGQDWKKGQS